VKAAERASWSGKLKAFITSGRFMVSRVTPGLGWSSSRSDVIVERFKGLANPLIVRLDDESLPQV
jgi:hypothetical protein